MAARDPLDDYPPHMTVEQVAEYTGISVERLRTWRKLSRGPVWVKMGDGHNGAVKYPREDLRAYVAERRRAPAVS